MVVLKGIIIVILGLAGALAICVVACLIGSIYLSTPYDEWIDKDKKRGKKNGKNHSR